MTGHDITDQDIEFFQLLGGIDAETKEEALRFFRLLGAKTGTAG